MGTSTVWQVAWNADLARYQICEQAGQGLVVSEIQVDGDAWREWLERVSSFAFQSKEGGHVTALKEHRGGGRVYWIAYRKIGGKLKRKYLGPSKEVTLTALEQVATALVQPEVPTASPPSPVTSPPVIDSMTPASERLPEQLLATKLLVPAPAHPLIRRSRLETLLNEGTRHPLTLVSAPAGFGKTSLLESWVQSLPLGGLQVAWVSLDEGDNDTVRFWSYVLTALDRCAPGVSQHTLALLQGPQAPALEYVLTMLINVLLQVPDTQVLILDDYHVIREPAIHASLDFLIEHQPPQLRLTLLSRADPPLKLSRLRARGQLLEVRDDDLRCSVEEAMQFLGEVMGIRLPNDVLQQVMTRTEGWLVGLQLLGLSLRGHADLTDLLDALAGTERYILDYLTEEVIRQQPASIQEFLLSTSILDPLSGPLCDAIMERTNSQEVLEELERANVFVCSLDRQRRWFRYHALFAEALRYRLERMHALRVSALHRRASHWYAEHNQTSKAVQHALLAQDWELAANLIEPAAWMLLSSKGNVQMMWNWLQQFPAEIVRTRPRLCQLYVSLILRAGPLKEADSWLQALEAALVSPSPEQEATISGLPEFSGRKRKQLLGQIAAFRALVAGYYGDEKQAEALCEQALSYLAQEDRFERALVASAKAMVAQVTGQATVAGDRLLEASRIHQDSGNLADAVSNMGVAAPFLHLQGRLHETWQICQQAIELVAPQGSPPSALAGIALAYQADVLREWNQLDAALEQVRESIHLGEQTGYMIALLTGYEVLVPILLSRGDLDGAEVALQQLARLPSIADNPYLRAWWITNSQVRLWLLRGELELATRWADKLLRGNRLASPFACEREDVARVRVLLARRQPDESLTLLKVLTAGATTTERFDHVIEMRILQALAHQMRNSEREALAALTEAVRLGEPEGYIRRFLDEGSVMEELLSKLRTQYRRHGPTPYLDTVLAAFPQEGRRDVTLRPSAPQQGLLDPLSERELEVLRELAHGASNQEIADRLVIAVDTVKRHVSNILAKLEVSNRTQAVARARSLSLLSDGQ